MPFLTICTKEPSSNASSQVTRSKFQSRVKFSYTSSMLEGNSLSAPNNNRFHIAVSFCMNVRSGPMYSVMASSEALSTSSRSR